MLYVLVVLDIFWIGSLSSFMKSLKGPMIFVYAENAFGFRNLAIV